MKYLLAIMIAALCIAPAVVAQKKQIQVKGRIQLADKPVFGDNGEIVVVQGGAWQDTLTILSIKSGGYFSFSLPDTMVGFQVFFNKTGYCSQHIPVYPELGDYELAITLNPGNIRSLDATNKVDWTGKNGELQEAACKARNNISRFPVKLMEYFASRSKIDSHTLATDPFYANGFDIVTELSRIEEQIKRTTNPVMRRILLMEYAGIDAMQQMVVRRKKPDGSQSNFQVFNGKGKIALLEETTRQLSPASAFWGFENDAIRWIIRQVPLTGEILQYSEQVIAEQATPEISASVLYGLAQRFQEEKKTEEFVIALTRLVSDYPGTNAANRAKADFSKFSNLAIGKTVPDFSVESVDKPGEMISSSSMKGKTYLIEFWTMGCKGCIMAMPELEKAYSKYRGKGFEILSIYLDKNLGILEQFRKKKHAMPWMNAFEPVGFKSDLTRNFEISWVPRSVLVGPDGKILAVDILPTDLMEKLHGLFNK
ncbi:MAG TPA: TlpA disulfide reductase family protein [Chitinophagaceae bacterium]|jgi:thiol-disulfide isomerase/thioredoxin|nr:TlpA disulfide reductase family protein [Chitinophagaceae bacterium]